MPELESIPFSHELPSAKVLEAIKELASEIPNFLAEKYQLTVKNLDVREKEKGHDVISISR